MKQIVGTVCKLTFKWEA